MRPPKDVRWSGDGCDIETTCTHRTECRKYGDLRHITGSVAKRPQVVPSSRSLCVRRTTLVRSPPRSLEHVAAKENRSGLIEAAISNRRPVASHTKPAKPEFQRAAWAGERTELGALGNNAAPAAAGTCVAFAPGGARGTAANCAEVPVHVAPCGSCARRRRHLHGLRHEKPQAASESRCWTPHATPQDSNMYASCVLSGKVGGDKDESQRWQVKQSETTQTKIRPPKRDKAARMRARTRPTVFGVGGRCAPRCRRMQKHCARATANSMRKAWSKQKENLVCNSANHQTLDPRIMAEHGQKHASGWN